MHLAVQEQAGLPLEAAVELTGEATGVHLTSRTGPDGRFVVQPLPFGPYRLRLTRPGFHEHVVLVDIRSEVPQTHTISLGLAPIETSVVVTDSDTLVDPSRTATVYFVGQGQLAEQHAAHRSRAVLELVNAQPGWLLEANGVLHPRGSEYSTQYVIDGVPIVDNRSPAFAPAFELEDLESMDVLTAGYPAEYGRKLGGVIELVSRRHPDRGTHVKFVADQGSFRTQAAR